MLKRPLSELPRDFAQKAHRLAEQNVERTLELWGHPTISEQERNALYILSLAAIAADIDTVVRK